MRADPPEVTLRRADAGDAPAIGAVFDAAVRGGWTFLGELAQRPMFTAQQWDELVVSYAPPNALLVATEEPHGVVGFTAVDAGTGEAFLFTEERNQRAIAVYEAAGYRPDGSTRESDFHGEPLRELRLVKPL